MDKTTAETVTEEMQKRIYTAWHDENGKTRRSPVWPNGKKEVNNDSNTPIQSQTKT